MWLICGRHAKFARVSKDNCVSDNVGRFLEAQPLYRDREEIFRERAGKRREIDGTDLSKTWRGTRVNHFTNNLKNIYQRSQLKNNHTIFEPVTGPHVTKATAHTTNRLALEKIIIAIKSLLFLKAGPGQLSLKF